MSALTAEMARARWAYDPETGIITNRITMGRAQAGREAGTTWTAIPGFPRRQLRADGISYLAHRVIWLMQTGEWPKNLIDHVNGNGLDNRWCNLREATVAENSRNTRPRRNGLKGVYRFNDRIFASIKVNGKNHFLGNFRTEAEAHSAYAVAAKHYFGEFARTS